jgi:hypothetical protein
MELTILTRQKSETQFNQREAYRKSVTPGHALSPHTGEWVTPLSTADPAAFWGGGRSYPQHPRSRDKGGANQSSCRRLVHLLLEGY